MCPTKMPNVLTDSPPGRIPEGVYGAAASDAPARHLDGDRCAGGQGTGTQRTGEDACIRLRVLPFLV